MSKLSDTLDRAQHCQFCGRMASITHAADCIDPSFLADPDSLDAAWAEAEAALPRDWMLERIFALDVDAWAADAEWDGDEDEPPAVFQLQATGRTPAAALRALTEKLRNHRATGESPSKARSAL